MSTDSKLAIVVQSYLPCASRSSQHNSGLCSAPSIIQPSAGSSLVLAKLLQNCDTAPSAGASPSIAVQINGLRVDGVVLGV